MSWLVTDLRRAVDDAVTVYRDLYRVVEIGSASDIEQMRARAHLEGALYWARLCAGRCVRYRERGKRYQVARERLHLVRAAARRLRRRIQG